MKNIISLDNLKQRSDEIQDLISIVYDGFMAIAMDYAYHIENVFGQEKDEKHRIYELRDNINYRIRSANLHLYLLFVRKQQIENRFEKMLSENPNVFDGYWMGNPHFEIASDDIMGIYDSIVFHLSSSFDYLSMLIQFVFGKNPESNLKWITLAKHCYNPNSEFSNRKFVENVKKVDNEFVKSFNDYRAELIHRQKSTSFASVTWELHSGKISTRFQISKKIKVNLKKILNNENEYCISYTAYELIKQTLLKISFVLEGIYCEFRENYNPHNPTFKKGKYQFATMNTKTKRVESPALKNWNKFMKYKNFC